MRRLYARRQEYFVELCQKYLRRWLSVREKDSSIQLLGQFAMPMNDVEVANLACQKGVDVQPVSINYYCDRPRHGLLLGYAALDEAETLKAVTLRATFEEIERARNKDANDKAAP
jgi:GntR family transcriptional regulator/MocR family aminotransferase